MRWSVEIKHLGGDNADLRDIFVDLGYLVEDVNTPAKQACMTCISHPMFDALNAADEVHLEARKLLKLLHSVLHTTSQYYFDECASPEALSVGEIFEVLETRERKLHYVEVPPAYTMVGFAVAPVPTGSGVGITGTPEQLEQIAKKEREEKARRCKRAIATIIAATKQSPRVSDVLSLKKQPQTPQNLGHIFDVIQDDLAGAINSIARKSKVSRFKRSINHPSVYGSRARHIVSNEEPPPKPMYLEEAEQFIGELVEQWLLLRAREAGVDGDVESLTQLFSTK